MSNDAPTDYVDVPGSLATAGQYRALGSFVGRTTIDNARLTYEKITRGEKEAGTTRQVYPHAHAAQSATCGTQWTPDLINETYIKTADGLIKTTLVTENWTELDRQRTQTVGNTSITTEIYALGVQAVTSSSRIKFRIKYCLASDSDICGATIHCLEETAAITMTSAQWKTIKGQLDGAGSTVSSLTVDGPTSVTDPDDTAAHVEIILEARSVTAVHSLYLYAWRSWAGSL